MQHFNATQAKIIIIIESKVSSIVSNITSPWSKSGTIGNQLIDTIRAFSKKIFYFQKATDHKLWTSPENFQTLGRARVLEAKSEKIEMVTPSGFCFQNVRGHFYSNGHFGERSFRTVFISVLTFIWNVIECRLKFFSEWP